MIVGVDNSRPQADYQDPSQLTWTASQWPLGAVPHSSNELHVLLQWLCHVDSTINVLGIIIIIIITIFILYYIYILFFILLKNYTPRSITIFYIVLYFYIIKKLYPT